MYEQRFAQATFFAYSTHGVSILTHAFLRIHTEGKSFNVRLTLYFLQSVFSAITVNCEKKIAKVVRCTIFFFSFLVIINAAEYHACGHAVCA